LFGKRAHLRELRLPLLSQSLGEVRTPSLVLFAFEHRGNRAPAVGDELVKVTGQFRPAAGRQLNCDRLRCIAEVVQVAPVGG
jgi:hypothetical protein